MLTTVVLPVLQLPFNFTFDTVSKSPDAYCSWGTVLVQIGH